MFAKVIGIEDIAIRQVGEVKLTCYILTSFVTSHKMLQAQAQGAFELSDGQLWIFVSALFLKQI